MPELPEVETMCRGIASAVGWCIVDVRQPKSRLQSIGISPPLREFRRRAIGRTITAVRRVGKRVVLELDAKDAESPHPNPLPKGEGTSRKLPKGEGIGGDCIVLEPRMTGLVLLADPPDRKHLRLIFQLRRGAKEKSLLFWDQRGLGVARFLSPAEFLDCYGPAKLGPDAMSISRDELRERLCGSRRAIKVALLDQHVLAGVGNLYASEILHLAHIHPATSCCRLKSAQWAGIHAAMKKVLRAAIRHQGSTLRDGTYRIARNRGGNYQVYHRVYQRADEPCLQCGKAQILRIVQAQRSTFYCPLCQRSCSIGGKR